MKKIFIIIAILFLNGSLFAQTGTIKLTVTGISPKEGNIIKIALYDKTGFLEEIKKHKTIKSEGNTAYVELKDIQIGKYAISVFQDENSDGKINTNFFGKPTERSGFSNNVKGDFGPPDFNEVAFDVIKDKSVDLTIHLGK